MRREVEAMVMLWFQDAHQVGRCPNCGYGAGLKMVVPARRRRGATQGDCAGRVKTRGTHIGGGAEGSSSPGNPIVTLKRMMFLDYMFLHCRE
nr:unnamed protein product [Digitaria exilis]